MLSIFSIILSSVFLLLLGSSCKAFKDKPILFLVGSKLIIFAVISSPTLTYSLISLTTQ